MAVLRKIELAIERGALSSELEQLSSHYYSLVPHNFGMSRPPVLRLAADLAKEIELVAALVKKAH